MSNSPPGASIERPHLTLFERIAVWMTWAIAGALFLTIGWHLMEPFDPEGPVSVLSSNGGALILVEAAVLAAVCAAVCTVIAGRYAVDVGIFAASLGLTAVSLRGGTTAYLLLYGTGRDGGVLPAGVLAIRFAVASLGWFVVVMVAAYVCHVVLKLCFPATLRGNAEGGPAELMLTTPVSDVPSFNFGEGRVLPKHTPVSDGLLHTACVGGIGLMAFRVLMASSAHRAIHHGQACFVVAASIWLGCYLAHRIVPVRSSLWALVGVCVTAVVGYLWAAITSGAGAFPPAIPQSPFMRVLPIQFIGAGAAMAVFMQWSAHMAALEDAHARRIATKFKAAS